MKLLFFTLYFWLKRFRGINNKNDNKYKNTNKNQQMQQIESER